MKKNNFYCLIALMIILSGCTGIIPGVGYTINDEQYKILLGKKYEVISPLKIVKYTYFGGDYFLARPERKETRDTEKIVDVPVGVIIIADHVSRVEHVEIETSYSYIGRFLTPDIFSGGFKLNALMEWQKRGPGKKNKVGPGRDEKNFKKDFLGMDAQYLKEIP